MGRQEGFEVRFELRKLRVAGSELSDGAIKLKERSPKDLRFPLTHFSYDDRRERDGS